MVANVVNRVRPVSPLRIDAGVSFAVFFFFSFVVFFELFSVFFFLVASMLWRILRGFLAVVWSVFIGKKKQRDRF